MITPKIVSKEFYYKQLGKAISLAAQVFSEYNDKQGRPYILHCLRVMNDISHEDPELQAVAVLHDVLEDCFDVWTMPKLVDELGLSMRQQVTLAALTHDPMVSYDDYIRAMAYQQDAVKIKLADLKDNSNITRLKGLRKKDFDRLEKYHKAFVYLSN